MFDTTEELLQRIPLGEDSTLEFKQLAYRGQDNRIIGPSRDDIADSIVAFANTRGGVLVLGVDDKTLEPTGIARDKLKAVMDWLTEILDKNIKPRLAASVKMIEVSIREGDTRTLVRIDVPMGLTLYRGSDYYERINASKRVMSPEAVARLGQHRSQSGLIRFEEQVVARAELSDLDPELYEKFVRPDQGDAEIQLRRLHLLTRHEGILKPTVLGALLACRQPGTLIPGAWLQLAAYRGKRNDPADQLDAREIDAPVDQQIEEALRFVERNMKIGAHKETTRTDIPQYSARAVFEAVVNAVAHRDYSLHGMPIRLFMFEDRLELTSPGALANTLSVESLSSLSLPRNELLSSFFARYFTVTDRYVGHAVLGRKTLMDRRGAGVDVILAETLKLSGKAARYEEIGRAALRLTIPAADPLAAPAQ